jgi:hypothetical protein
MSSKTIFTVGFDLPTDKFETVNIKSNQTLADADIILIEAKLVSDNYEECKTTSRHWRSEILNAFKAGKTIFIYLPHRTKVSNYRHETIDSFKNMIPLMDTYSSNKKGKKVKFTEEGKLLINYWNIVKDMSSYESILNFSGTPLLKTNDNTDIVGGYFTEKSLGTMIYLPPIKLPKDFKLITWTEESKNFGHNLAKEIISIDKKLKTTDVLSLKPEWISVPEFTILKENELNEIISNKMQNIKELEEEIKNLNDELKENLVPKQLLYETGIPLENAIIHGLRIIGFDAKNFQDEESEFDIVFSSEEGRFIGEAEGKDNKAIAITKARQLEINIQEDFDKDGVDSYAFGVLFGNGYRLTKPSQRGDEFTTKVQTLAKRSGILLVATSKLFEVVKYIHDSNDQNYAKSVRECFRDTKGKIMVFPSIPDTSAK